MLSLQREITFTGRSIIDGVEVVGFSAKIKSDDPTNITFSSWQMNKELYKTNREQCRKDEADFEDKVYEAQDELINAQGESVNEN